MNAAQLINQTSGEVEYYTDPKILAAAREVMGRIDLDPASSLAANAHVKALTWFGWNGKAFTDGLFENWSGIVWLNHPFGRPEKACSQPCDRKKKNPKHVCHTIDYHGNAAWIEKLSAELDRHNVRESMCITYACTSESWFQPLFEGMNCFLCPRTNYYLPDGTIKKGVTKGSVVTYFGPNKLKFRSVFRRFGYVK